MKIFECDHCGHALFFENHRCEKCRHLVGYSSSDQDVLTFDAAQLTMTSDKDGKLYRYCANRQYEVCNWLIPLEKGGKFCKACELNRTIPNLSDRQNFQKWKKLEVAKHRLIYQLDQLKLPYQSKLKNPTEGVCFDFLSRSPSHNRMTGHASGVITILLDEADSVHLEKMKSELLEPYRTLIGHFRHEVGHYFWDLLIAKDPKILEEFRSIFGDERADYGKALLKYYQSKYKTDWQGNFISQYASSHPWEDWAETWANYLHIMAMAETAFSFGMTVNPNLNERSLQGTIDFDPYETQDFDRIFKAWFPVSFAINSLNRSMGIPDAYPFVINSAVLRKMRFIHRLLNRLR
jgi:hypothetical protein